MTWFKTSLLLSVAIFSATTLQTYADESAQEQSIEAKATEPCCGVGDAETDEANRTVTCYIHAENSMGMTYLPDGTATESTCQSAVDVAYEKAKEDLESFNEMLPEGFPQFEEVDRTYTCGSCENSGCPPEDVMRDETRVWQATITATCLNGRHKRRYKTRKSAWALSAAIAKTICAEPNFVQVKIVELKVED